MLSMSIQRHCKRKRISRLSGYGDHNSLLASRTASGLPAPELPGPV